MKTLSDDNNSVNFICDEFAASKHAELVKNAISNEIYYVSIVIANKLCINDICTQYIVLQFVLG